MLIVVRPSCVPTHAASEVTQHQLKDNGPERCLTPAQDENLIEPCVCKRECMTAQLRCALTSLFAEKSRANRVGAVCLPARLGTGRVVQSLLPSSVDCMEKSSGASAEALDFGRFTNLWRALIAQHHREGDVI